MGVESAAGDLRDKLAEGVLGGRATDAFEEDALGDGEHLVARLLAPAPVELAGAVEPGAMLVDGVDKLRDTIARGGHGREDGDLAALYGGEREEGAELADKHIGAGAVGLVHDEHVGNLDDAGLERLDVVASAGIVDEHGAEGGAGDLDLVLARADGLDEDVGGSRKRP